MHFCAFRMAKRFERADTQARFGSTDYETKNPMIPPKNILVPTDFSPNATHALEYALDLAKKLEAKVTVLHVYEIPVLGVPDGTLVLAANIAEQIVLGADQALVDLAARCKARGIEVSTRLENGDARDSVEAVAREIDADLVVMGTHGRRGVSRLLMGSVAEAVLRTSTRPVLIVRTPDSGKA